MKLVDIKFILLFFLIPLHSLADPNPTYVSPQLVKIGMDVNMLNKIKSKSLKTGESYMSRDVPKIKGLKFKEIKMVWKQDSLYSLMCVLDIENGTKLLEIFIKEYGAPSTAGVLDIYEWFTEQHSFSFTKQEENFVVNFKGLPFLKNRKQQEEFNWDKLTD